MEEKKQTYKTAFARLQEIQTLIETHRPDVDELSDILKEAASLLKFCKDKLFVVNEETKKIIKEIQ